MCPVKYDNVKLQKPWRLLSLFISIGLSSAVEHSLKQQLAYIAEITKMRIEEGHKGICKNYL